MKSSLPLAVLSKLINNKLKILNFNSFLSGLTNNPRLFGSCNTLTSTRSTPLIISSFSRGIVCLCSISFQPLLCLYQRFCLEKQYFDGRSFHFFMMCIYIYIYIYIYLHTFICITYICNIILHIYIY